MRLFLFCHLDGRRDHIKTVGKLAIKVVSIYCVIPSEAEETYGAYLKLEIKLKIKGFLFSLFLITLFSCDPLIKKEYYDNGKIKSEIHISKGEVLFGKTYFPNGKIERIINFKNGKKNGKAIYYFENGKVEIEQNYLDDSLDGLMLQFFESGEKMGEDFYKNGRIISGGSFDRNGDSISVHRGNVIRTYGSGKIYVLDCLANTHKIKTSGTIKFSDKGEILEYKGPLTCLTKNDTILLDARNPEWRNLKTDFKK